MKDKNRHHHVALAVAAVAVFTLTAGQARAATILGNSINDDVSPGLQTALFYSSNPFEADYQSTYTIGFTMPGQSYTLTDVSVRLGEYAVYDAGLAYVSIVRDGGLNNPFLSSFPLVHFPAVSVGQTTDNYTFTPTGTVTLAANTMYWLRVETESGNWFDWKKAIDAPTGVAAVSGYTRMYSDFGEPYGTQHFSYAAFNPRFEIHGEPDGVAPIPEPSTVLLLGIGMVGLVGYGRRRLKK